MPTHGAPRIGRDDAMSELRQSPEVLGTIREELLNPSPQAPSAAWQSGGTQVDLTEPPPPWELEDAKYTASDARRYVDCPSAWILRWANPRLIEQTGFNYWSPVLPDSDKDVKLKVSQMKAPDGTIRRGGATGDILVWMLRSWVESRRRQHLEATARLTQGAVNRQEELKDDFKRGKYGPHVTLDEARHPSHTMAEGRSMRD